LIKKNEKIKPDAGFLLLDTGFWLLLNDSLEAPFRPWVLAGKCLPVKPVTSNQ
jgi:hypothetical protein